MNLYSNKQRWKLALLIVAAVIVGITLWYSNFIADKIKNEERQKVELWSEAIQRRAKLVKFTQELFDELRDEERKKAEILRRAYKILDNPKDASDLTFVTELIWSNTTIPVMIFDESGRKMLDKNLPEDKQNDQQYIDSLKTVIEEKEQIIEFDIASDKQYLYYNDSYIFEELQVVLNDLINSFISETVMNSASVPVILTDSSRSEVIRVGNVEESSIDTPEKLQARIRSMAEQNQPIQIELPGQGVNYIFYEDSVILTQLKYYPVIQLILIGVFLLVAYLLFSTFRKAEQNQVWVGMAKETAHQLGTPLSSLMAWMSMLESQGVDKATMIELNKDVERLEMITDRFSKIGSKPDLKELDIVEVLEESMEYLRNRLSRQVKFTIEADERPIFAKLNKPLFSWVIENLTKNAVDAMGGKGEFNIHISRLEDEVFVDVSDTGKGISNRKKKTVFEPGFTTKKRGWGLGLSLVKRIVENYHSGRIFVKRSEVGKGTTFRIILKD
ncbi:sensor histidine kinase [Halocola ammonii]